MTFKISDDALLPKDHPYFDREVNVPEPPEGSAFVLTDLKLNRKHARVLAEVMAADLDMVVEVIFQSGKEIAGRELTVQELRDRNRCPACNNVRFTVDANGQGSCRWCGWRGDPDTYVKPGYHLEDPVLRPVDYRPLTEDEEEMIKGGTR